MPEEKIFTIPLRKAFEAQRTYRAKKAIAIVREFLERHMKSENIKIGKSINENIWKRGIQKPPRKIRIHAIKEDDVIYAEILGVDIKPPAKEEIKKKEGKILEKIKKIRERRKERKTIQEELEEEAGKKKEAKEKISELPEERKLEEKIEEKQEEKTKEVRKIK